METVRLHLGWAPHMPVSRFWAVSEVSALPPGERLLGLLGLQRPKDRATGPGNRCLCSSPPPPRQEVWPTVYSGHCFGSHPLLGEVEAVYGRSCLLGAPLGSSRDSGLSHMRGTVSLLT